MYFLTQVGGTVKFSDGTAQTFEPGKAAEVPDRFIQEAERAGLQRIVEAPSGTTAQRPAGLPVGSMYYDTALARPIWWDGAAWRDASGATA